MIKVYLIIKQLTNNKKINHVKRLFSVICKKFRLKIAVFVITKDDCFLVVLKRSDNKWDSKILF